MCVVVCRVCSVQYTLTFPDWAGAWRVSPAMTASAQGWAVRPGRGLWVEDGAPSASPGLVWRLCAAEAGAGTRGRSWAWPGGHQTPAGPAIITRQLTSGITGHWPGTSVTTLRPVRLGDMARRYPSSSYDSRYSRGYMSVNSSSYLAGDRREGVSYR